VRFTFLARLIPYAILRATRSCPWGMQSNDIGEYSLARSPLTGGNCLPACTTEQEKRLLSRHDVSFNTHMLRQQIRDLRVFLFLTPPNPEPPRYTVCHWRHTRPNASKHIFRPIDERTSDRRSPKSPSTSHTAWHSTYMYVNNYGTRFRGVQKPGRQVPPSLPISRLFEGMAYAGGCRR
jgi:hypothetical protein